jgi:group II intron reverse transcriptase/maturase
VAKLVFEPLVEKHFLPDSYGYRPRKSALDAIGVTRLRCWRYDWVLEFDIKGLFDNIPHDLLMRAVAKHVDEEWVKLYIERWLKAPMQHSDGTIVSRNCGTPQGGIVSPILSNLFLHYTFDVWLQRTYPKLMWCRYADDGLVHCETQEQAEQLLVDLEKRFAQCGLELHPKKTRIVYCKDNKRTGNYPEKEFTFLGYTFRGRVTKGSVSNRLFIGFTPAVSKVALNAMRAKTRESKMRKRTELSLEDIARWFNPILQGWISYYGRYRRSALYPMLRHFNKTLVLWARNKYRRFRGSKTKSAEFLEKVSQRNTRLFAHWQMGMIGAFA